VRFGLVEAFRWDEFNGMQGLGDLPGGAFQSSATAISASGEVIVGYSQSASGGEAFRWEAVSGMQGLGDLPGGVFGSGAYAVSADGSVIVGAGHSDAPDNEAFIWTEAEGMQSLQILLASLGLDLSGWTDVTPS
jgi:probable HAF family extracellular repeat protein